MDVVLSGLLLSLISISYEVQYSLMNHRIFELSIDHWQPHIESELAQAATAALESGKVVYLPRLNFSLDSAQQSLLTMPVVPSGAKNISYNPKNQSISGLDGDISTVSLLKTLMQRYHHLSTQLMNTLSPQYRAADCGGRTSFRPVEIKGRKPVSYRKDDTRLHVDAFPSTPVNKSRILRVFTNINPYGENRLWRLGEPFAEVIHQFLPRARKMLPLEAEILYCVKATRQKRSHYDHYMLQIHNTMKHDVEYQRQCAAVPMEFPPGSTWIVYTDLVSHAALAGRFVLEQTYYPAVDNMLNPALSPQRQMHASVHYRGK